MISISDMTMMIRGRRIDTVVIVLGEKDATTEFSICCRGGRCRLPRTRTCAVLGCGERLRGVVVR